MANVSELLTLGIGTPSTIPYLIRFGLGQGSVAGATYVTGGWPERLGGRMVESFSTPRIESFGGRKVERL